MAKHSMKQGGMTGANGTIVSRTSKTSQVGGGESALTAPRNLATDGQGAGDGTHYGRYTSTKPSNSSGNIGVSTAIKSKYPAITKYEPATRGSLTHKVTKPQK